MMHRLLLLTGCLGGLAGCRIYAPLLPTPPDIRAKGEAEVCLSARMSCQFGATAAYSPLNHLLVRAAAGGQRGSNVPDERFRTGQYEGSLGSYWALGPRWQVGSFAGLGWGRTRWDMPHRIDSLAYNVRFRRPFGEAYVQWFVSPYTSLGASYRLNYLDFTTFTDAGVPTGVRAVRRHEPLLFGRTGDARGGDFGAIAAQWSIGLTIADNLRLSQRNARTDDAAVQATEPMLHTTFSIIIRPHYLWQRPARRLRTP